MQTQREDASSSWVPASQVGNQNRVPGSQLQLLAMLGIWGVTSERELAHSLALSLSLCCCLLGRKKSLSFMLKMVGNDVISFPFRVNDALYGSEIYLGKSK